MSLLGRVGTWVVQTPSPWAMVASRCDVRAEQAGEDLGLGLAELRELLGDVRDGAVVLAQLLPHGCAAPGRARRGSVTVAGQGLGQGLRAAGDTAVCGSVDDRPVARLELGDPLPGERGDGLAATGLLDEPQRAGGEVVVGLVEGVAAGLGHREQPGRAPAAADGGGPRLALLDQAVGQQGVEVAADGRRGEAHLERQGGGGGGTVLEDGPRDAVPRPVLHG